MTSMYVPGLSISYSTRHSARHSLNYAQNVINLKRNFKENIIKNYLGERITKEVVMIFFCVSLMYFKTITFIHTRKTYINGKLQ